jgi:hypothetical protein
LHSRALILKLGGIKVAESVTRIKFAVCVVRVAPHTRGVKNVRDSIIRYIVFRSSDAVLPAMIPNTMLLILKCVTRQHLNKSRTNLRKSMRWNN